MGKILEYIQKYSNGKCQCYKTKKLSLDGNDNDVIAYNYDGNSGVQTTKSIFVKTDRSRQGVVSLCNSDFRETYFPDIVKCEMALLNEDKPIETDIINVISANPIRGDKTHCNFTKKSYEKKAKHRCN
jgi:hypothetical protein